MEDSTIEQILSTRPRLRCLAEQLACEYAGAVPPGQVMHHVVVTARRLRRSGCTDDRLLALTRSTVRARLVALVGDDLAQRRSGRAG